MPIESYVSAVVLPILAHPDAFKITQTTDAMGVLISLTVHQEDMGILIGKSGETAKAIRHLVRIVGMRSAARVSLKITEPDGSSKRPAKIELTESFNTHE